MAQTRKRRRRKHRGTQGGRIDSGGRRPRPRSREEARARARSRGSRKGGATRFDNPPTWRGATIRGIVAAALFIVLLLALFGRPVGEALAFGAFMLAFYIPAGYFIDTLIWRRRERSRMRARQGD
jgi:hypothetical protein